MTSPAQERNDVLAELGDAVALLVSSMDARLVPVNGGNIGYAIRGARDWTAVAAVSGGLVADGKGVLCAGPVAFGVDEWFSRTILTAMKFDPEVRSSAVIRYTGTAFRILSDMYAESAETNPAKHPGGTSTMDWAIASCCSDGVPPVIAIRANDPEQQVIVIFGDEPSYIASNIIILSNRIE